MKYGCLTMLLLVVFCHEIHAQFEDSYGKIRPQDVDIKECSFDPSASLVITLDEGLTEYNAHAEPITYRHVRMKVLKEEGKKYADFSITYPSRWNYIVIDQLEGKCINIGENGFVNEYDVNKKSIFTRKVNRYYTQIRFAFPEVKVGSILEYKYRCTNTKAWWSIEDWNFQQQFPVYQSTYKYKSHPQIEVIYALQKKAEYPAIIQPDNEKKTVLFQMNNIPALDDEPFMDGRETYLQKVRFQITAVANWNGFSTYNTSWGALAGQMMSIDQFGKYIKTKSSETNDFVLSLTSNKSEFEKMKAIHEYVKKTFKWNEDESLLANISYKEVWKNKTGNSAAINMMMINMMRAAGLKADPVLICGRQGGRVDESFPHLSQFDNVFAVVTANNRLYFLDGTDKTTPCTITNPQILNTKGFIISSETAHIITIAEVELKYKNNVAIEASLNDSGTLTGNAQVTSREYARIASVDKYKTALAKDSVTESFKKGTPDLNIDSFTVANIDNDSLPIVQSFKFKTKLQQSGDYSLVPLNMFSGLPANPFIAESRVSDINFGYKHAYSVNYVLNLPASKKPDAIPKDVQLLNDDKSLSFSRNIIYNEQTNQLIARIKIEFKRSLYDSEQYSDVKQFFKKMYNLLEEPCAIKNK
jgi:hypothetical protein